MCVWTAQAWSDCMYTLLENRSKKDLNSVVVLTFLETLFQDGRSGLQGVSKGCQRVAPWDPNVAPAVSNVAHGAVKVAAGVSKGAQRVPKAWPRAPKRCPREPKGCPRCAQGSLRVPTSATTTNKHTNEQQTSHKLDPLDVN